MEAPKTLNDFHVFKIKNMWSYFKGQHFSFWMICCYLFFEFVRPQGLFPAIDFLPWAQLFILGSLVGVFVDPTVKHVRSPANVYVVIFSILIIISIFTAYNTEIAKNKFMDFFSWVIIYFLIIKIVNTKERFYIFLLIFLVAAGKIAIGTARAWVFRGFSFTSWGLMGPAGFFQNSGELAILMVMLFPLAFYLYQHFKSSAAWWERLVLLALWVCPVLTVMGASSRGSQVALICVMAIMFRKSLFRIKPLIGVVTLVIGLVWLLPDEQKERFSEAGEDKTSQQRLLYWENGWEMMKEHPLTGVGFFNFIPYYNNYYANDVLFEDRGAELPHNIFVQVGTDAGFPALFFFMAMILYAIMSTWSLKKRKGDPLFSAIAAGLGLGVLGFVIAGQFVTVTYYPFFWVHLAFLVSLSNVMKTNINASN